MTTNYNNRLYEHGATANNTRVDDTTIPITLLPWPDLQVAQITSPAAADSGQSIAVDFTIINQGNAATTSPNWTDRVYLSLDPTISSDDILVGSLINQSALEPGESYPTTTDTVLIPNDFAAPCTSSCRPTPGTRWMNFPTMGTTPALRNCTSAPNRSPTS